MTKIPPKTSVHRNSTSGSSKLTKQSYKVFGNIRSLGALDILQKQLSFIRQLVIADFLPFLFGSSTVLFPLQKTVRDFPQFSVTLPNFFWANETSSQRLHCCQPYFCQYPVLLTSLTLEITNVFHMWPTLPSERLVRAFEPIRNEEIFWM